MTRLRSVLAHVALLATSVALPLIAFEFYLKWDNRRPDARQYVREYTVNGESYRFVATKEAFDDAAHAVVIAGDSFTAGFTCADGRTFPDYFSRAAKRQGVALNGLNLGIAGTGPSSFVARVRDYLTDKGPAAGVILSLYANDVEIDCFACRRAQEWRRLAGLTPAQERELDALCEPCMRASGQRVSGEVAGDIDSIRRVNWWLADHSLSFLVFREGLAKVLFAVGLLPRDWGRGSYPARWGDLDGLYYKYIRGSVASARIETERLGIPLVVLFYPDSMNLSIGNEFYSLYRRVGEALQRDVGVPAHSGYDGFLSDPRTSTNMPYSLTDTHPSCLAHEIMGDWAYQKWSETLRARSGPARE